MTIPLVIGVNPLQTTLFELGIVSGREVLLLRSAEIQPVFVRFVPNCFGSSPLPSPWLSQLQGGLARAHVHKCHASSCPEKNPAGAKHKRQNPYVWWWVFQVFRYVSSQPYAKPFRLYYLENNLYWFMGVLTVMGFVGCFIECLGEGLGLRAGS